MAISARPGTVARLAAFLNCSLSTANRLCRANAGLSLLHWVRRQRLEQARLLLVGTRLPISEVGRRVGIENPFHFSKAFKQWLGESPRAYRRRTPLI